jgi:hypothetical protein
MSAAQGLGRGPGGGGSSRFQAATPSPPTKDHDEPAGCPWRHSLHMPTHLASGRVACYGTHASHSVACSPTTVHSPTQSTPQAPSTHEPVVRVPAKRLPRWSYQVLPSPSLPPRRRLLGKTEGAARCSEGHLRSFIKEQNPGELQNPPKGDVEIAATPTLPQGSFCMVATVCRFCVPAGAPTPGPRAPNFDGAGVAISRCACMVRSIAVADSLQQPKRNGANGCRKARPGRGGRLGAKPAMQLKRCRLLRPDIPAGLREVTSGAVSLTESSFVHQSLLCSRL